MCKFWSIGVLSIGWCFGLGFDIPGKAIRSFGHAWSVFDSLGQGADLSHNLILLRHANGYLVRIYYYSH